jgi:hypothetical protein
MVEPTSEARALAERALRGAEYDWERLLRIDSSGVLHAGPLRHGVRCLLVRDRAMADAARDALLAWRLAQYLLVNFYDTGRVAGWRELREPREWIGPDDCHALALDGEWRLVAYSALKRARRADVAWRFGDARRPALLPCEDVQGRGWQRDLVAGRDVPMARCCEMGRSMSDRTRADAAARRAPVELALLACQLVHRPRFDGAIRLVAGDLDPRVILRNLRYFFVPAATWPARAIDLGEGHPLRPRYLESPTSPFVVLVGDIGTSAYLRWADVEGALDLEDSQALPRLQALSQFTSVHESSCLPSRAAGPPGTEVVLGPGEEADRERVALVVDGCLQAFGPCPGGLSHLASLGRGVAHVPRAGLAASVARLRAVAPSRVLLSSPEEFERWTASRSTAS